MINNSDKKSFGRDVTKLVTGTVIAQAIGICLTPIITRIFSPDIYGVASVFLSLVSIITVIACLRYEMAIMLPKDDKDAGAVFLLCLIILIGISILCIPILFLFGEFIAGVLGNAAIKDYLFLIPVAVFIDGLYLALRYWNTRKKRFGTQATTQALQSISGSGLKLGLGVSGFVSPLSLIVSGILGNLIGTIILARQAIRSDLKLIVQSASWKNIRKQAKIYKKFPLIDSGNQWINTLSWQMPVLMLTGLFSSTVAGLYSLGFQMLQLPMSLIGGSIGQVFYQRAALAKHNNTLSEVVESTCSVLILISICPFLLLLVAGEDLFSIVFGTAWSEAGFIVQILALWTLVWFVSSPLSHIVGVLGIQGFGLKMSFANLITRFLSLFIGGLIGSLYMAILLFAVSGFFVYGYCLYVWITKPGGSVHNVFKKVWKCCITWSGIIIVFGALSIVISSSYVISVIAIILGIGYMIYLFKRNPLVKEYF